MRSASSPQTPPGSSRRSLPPSQLLQQRPGPFREADGLLGRLGLGCERGRRGARSSCAHGEGAPQSPGKSSPGLLGLQSPGCPSLHTPLSSREGSQSWERIKLTWCRELNCEKEARDPPAKWCCSPVEGVNLQAVKDLKSLASAAALKGQVSASKWLSAQTRLPRRPWQLHPLLHHPLDAKSFPEPILIIIFILNHPCLATPRPQSANSTHYRTPSGAVQILHEAEGKKNHKQTNKKNRNCLSPLTCALPTNLRHPTSAHVPVSWDWEVPLCPLPRSGDILTPTSSPEPWEG